MSMDINGLNTNQSGSSKAKSSSQVNKADGNAKDNSPPIQNAAKETVVISPQAKSLSKISAQVSTETPVDQARVDAIKASLRDGTFKLDAESVAGKLLDTDDLF